MMSFLRQRCILLFTIGALTAVIVNASAVTSITAQQQTAVDGFPVRHRVIRQPVDVNLDGRDEVLSYISLNWRGLPIKGYGVVLSYEDETVWKLHWVDGSLDVLPFSRASRAPLWLNVITNEVIEMFPQHDTQNRTYMLVRSLTDIETYQFVLIRWDDWQPEIVLDLDQIGCPAWQINDARRLTISGLQPFPNQGCTVYPLEYVIEDAVFEDR